MTAFSNVYLISGAVVTRTNEDGAFDTTVDDFKVLAADAPTALATATTYLTNLFPAQLGIQFTDDATLVAQNVITTP